MTARLAWEISKGSVSEFFEDKAPRLAAALAYYALFSLGPLLVIVIGVAGLFFEKNAVSHEVTSQIQSFVGDKGAGTIESMLKRGNGNSSLIATVLGTLALVFGATGVFGQLQDALNTIWEVKLKPGQGVWAFIRSRFLSFAMVFGIAFLLLISMVITTLLEAFSGAISQVLPVPAMVVRVLHLGISFVVITLLFAMIFKLLPDARVRWRDVWVGAMGTSLLFTLGKSLIALYLGRESTSSAYGAAGSVIIILLWVYYSSLILFFGAEFTQVYARKTGSKIVPRPNAEAVTEDARARQGIPHSPRDQVSDSGREGELAEAHMSASTTRDRIQVNGSGESPATALAIGLGAGFVGGWIAHRSFTVAISRKARAAPQGRGS